MAHAGAVAGIRRTLRDNLRGQRAADLRAAVGWGGAHGAGAAGVAAAAGGGAVSARGVHGELDGAGAQPRDSAAGRGDGAVPVVDERADGGICNVAGADGADHRPLAGPSAVAVARGPGEQAMMDLISQVSVPTRVMVVPLAVL